MLAPGELVEGTPYRVLREIGAGGMGVVYEVEHTRLAKRYVAKVLRAAIQNIPGALARIDREARVLADLDHANVVQIHDFGTTPQGIRYLVMEKLVGDDLRERIVAGNRPRPASAMRIVAEMLDALTYVHARGIVHRDIKPANVFLAEGPAGPVTKVLDFGIAHVVEGQTSDALTKTGAFLGTLEYAAPEQMQGAPASPATDVYSAGLVLFELLAGRGPFANAPGVGVIRCFQPAPRLGSFVEVASALDDLVARMLAIDPAARPSARDAALQLRALPADAVREPVDGVSVDDLLANLGPRPPSAARFSQRTEPLAVAPVTGPGLATTVDPRSSRPRVVVMAAVAAALVVAIGSASFVAYRKAGGRKEAVTSVTTSAAAAVAPAPAGAPLPSASAVQPVAAVQPEAVPSVSATAPAVVAKPAAPARPVAPAAKPSAKSGYITELPP